MLVSAQLARIEKTGCGERFVDFLHAVLQFRRQIRVPVALVIRSEGDPEMGEHIEAGARVDFSSVPAGWFFPKRIIQSLRVNPPRRAG
jgi:hypothetical protein